MRFGRAASFTPLCAAAMLMRSSSWSNWTVTRPFSASVWVMVPRDALHPNVFFATVAPIETAPIPGDLSGAPSVLWVLWVSSPDERESKSGSGVKPVNTR